jgi:secreted trypsin-like serine protease
LELTEFSFCPRSLVRLGEHDTSTDSETQHIDVQVLKVVAHPDYDTKDGNNDLAIVYLTKDVAYTDLIRPVCLPSVELPNRSRRPYIAGWGYTQEGGKVATVLQELEVTVYNNSVCVENYKATGKLLTLKEFDENIVLCAGSLDGTKDACKGDGGGPLMSSAAG